MGRYRPRKEIKTWFYRDIDEQARLIEFVDYLKATRQLAKVVRNGIRLMWSLGEGDLSVLFELFPGLKTQFEAPIPAPVPPDSSTIERKLEHLERLIIEQGGIAPPPADYPMNKPAASAGPKPLAVPKLAPVVIDDDDDLLGEVKKSASFDPSANFFAAILGTVGNGARAEQ